MFKKFFASVLCVACVVFTGGQKTSTQKAYEGQLQGQTIETGLKGVAESKANAPDKAADRVPAVQIAPAEAKRTNLESLTLSKALKAEKERLGWQDKDWREHSISDDACVVLVRVYLPCSYNTLRTLSLFLAINGKGLFPPGNGTDVYDAFTGTPAQTDRLLKSIEANRNVFVWGELTGEDVRNKWQTTTPPPPSQPQEHKPKKRTFILQRGDNKAPR